MKNKGGQETGTSLLWWIVAIIVFALIVYFVYTFYNDAIDKTDLLPEDISIYAGVCDNYGSSDIGGFSKSAYCREFKEIKLSNSIVYLSCQDKRILNTIKNKIDCSGEGLGERETAISKCKELQQTAISKGKTFEGKKIIINQLGNCEELLANSQPIQPTDTGIKCESSQNSVEIKTGETAIEKCRSTYGQTVVKSNSTFACCS